MRNEVSISQNTTYKHTNCSNKELFVEQHHILTKYTYCAKLSVNEMVNLVQKNCQMMHKCPFFIEYAQSLKQRAEGNYCNLVDDHSRNPRYL